MHVMEFRFDANLYSNMGNENSDTGHIKCSRGPQVPHPCPRICRWWVRNRCFHWWTSCLMKLKLKTLCWKFC